jgi:peroxiredoxin
MGWLTLFWLSGPAVAESRDAPDESITLEGLVLNHFGGGVDGAEVRIELPDAPAEHDPIAAAQTTSGGSVEVVIPADAPEIVRLRIRAEGFKEYLRQVNLAELRDLPFVDATLEGAATLSGTVTAAISEEPIAEAGVICENGGRRLFVQTDGTGKYVFDTIYHGPATVTVTAEGYGAKRESLRIATNNYRHDVTLHAEQIIELKVRTNTGEPAEDAFVEAIVRPSQYYVTLKTDEEGEATIRGVDPQAEFVHIKLSGEKYIANEFEEKTVALPSVTDEVEVEVQVGKPDPLKVELTLTVAGRLQGIVTDAETGEPISNVRIVAGGELRYDMPIAWSGYGGQYLLGGVRPGLVPVSFQHEAYAPHVRDVELNTGEVTEVNARLERGKPIAGRVVDESGAPIEHVWITAERWRGYRTLGLRTITDEEGVFRFDHAPGGTIEFSFVKPGYGQPITEKLTYGREDYEITLKLLEAQPESPPLPGMSRLSRLENGDPVPDLPLTDINGTVYELDALRGKFVFIDIWATWCGPCVGEIPNVRKLYEQAKERPDFLLLGISLDTDRTALNRFVTEHQMEWPQVFGPNSGAQKAFETFSGVGIPYTCLISPDGQILAQELRGPGMADRVIELMDDYKTSEETETK